jgi:hypothetical protein
MDSRRLCCKLMAGTEASEAFLAQTSSGLENKRYSLAERRGADTERTFDDARLAADVARDVENRRLAFA